ncbi:MAG: acyl-CoA synthetase [Desulfarculus sp.]|nr:MAG: acyl-CoA synthetase [Desulfarculus sp.]
MAPVRIPARELKANLLDYQQACRDFAWPQVEAEFSWQAGGRLNLAYEAVDRRLERGLRPEHPALVMYGGGPPDTYSYRQLYEDSCRLSNLLAAEGLAPGDRLAILLPPLPEIFLAMLASARAGVVFCCLSPHLSRESLDRLLADLEPRAILTHPGLAERLPWQAPPAGLKLFWLLEPPGGLPTGQVSLARALPGLPGQCHPQWVAPEHPLYIAYTVTGDGPPSGTVHTHGDLSGMLSSARYALDLQEHSVLFCDHEPWGVAATVYSALAPWLCGVTSVVQPAPFAASTWYETLQQAGVTAWYTSPAVLRGLAAAGGELPGRYDLSRLEHIATVGEPLSQELFFWTRNQLGLPPHDTWWMAETGIIALANYPSQDIKLGSCGRPLPGLEAAVVDQEGRPQTLLTLGELALRPSWPGLFSGLWRDQERYRRYFDSQGWFRTGNLALIDEDGYFYVQGRADDLLRVQDRVLGPYEVESLFLARPEVAQAAVIAKPGPGHRPIYKAYLVLAAGHAPSDELRGRLLAQAQARLAPYVPLREIEFMAALPRSSSGRLLRRGLRALDLGLPLGRSQSLADD